MRRRNRGGNKNFMGGRYAIGSGTLTDRAVQTGLVYKYLDYVSPADVEGIKRAYVNVNDKDIETAPIPADSAAIAQMYGAKGMGQKPTTIADKNKPMAMIAKYSPKDNQFPELERYGSQLLRSALRKIVDEV